MGIRYDNDSRRATNGPMIFFSDPSSQGAFAEEIRRAIGSRLSFYAYRTPGDYMISFGSSEGFIEGMGTPGFVIGFFDPSKPIITIPYREGVEKKFQVEKLYSVPTESTTYEQYHSELAHILETLREGKAEKVVAAKVVVVNEQLNIAEKFFEFCQRFPESYIFCFGTPATGCWIGASPELLLEGREDVLTSMALAGTRRAGATSDWDDKNIEEQKIVADYIKGIFETTGLTTEVGERVTKVTGGIEHICSQIRGHLPNKETFNLEEMLRKLSPTPALCGTPKELALQEIMQMEHFDRGCYGGFCGPFHSLSDFTFNVVLRCASFDERRYCAYSGGGITPRSDIEAEWEETELKIRNTFRLT